MKRVDVAIAIISRADALLICRRRDTDRLGGYWEFPGGKRRDDETVEQCLARELQEELDIEVEVIAALPAIEHDYPDIRVRLHPYLCAHKSGEPAPIGCAETKWVQPHELREYRFPAANKELIEEVIRRTTVAK
jgi:8-oxo-dGTP diphosphatase/A/G-specific adenine glycosylase